LGNACGNVLAHCHGHQNDQQIKCIFSSLFYLLLPWLPLGQYAASSCQWWHPVAYGIALDMLHQEMHFILHRRTIMAIDMASGGGGLFPIDDFLS
jgi:hypothetical protein